MFTSIALVAFYIFVMILCFFVLMVIISPYSTSRIEPELYKTLTKQNAIPTDLPFCIRSDIQTAQFELLKKVIAELEEHKIEYWLTGDSLLDAYNYQDIAPWNDHVSIAIHLKDAHIFYSPHQSYDHFTIKLTPHGFRCVSNNWTEYPVVEMQLFNTQSDSALNVCTPFNEIGECTFKDGFKTPIEHSLIFPLAICKFRDQYVKVPNSIQAYIDHMHNDEVQSRHIGTKKIANSASVMVFCNNRQTRSVISSMKAVLVGLLHHV